MLDSNPVMAVAKRLTIEMVRRRGLYRDSVGLVETDLSAVQHALVSAQGRFEDVLRGGYDPAQHLEDMALDGVAGEVLYPSQGLFYFKVAEAPLMSAIFRAYNDWLAEFCRTDPARLKGIAVINLDDGPRTSATSNPSTSRSGPPPRRSACP